MNTTWSICLAFLFQFGCNPESQDHNAAVNNAFNKDDDQQSDTDTNSPSDEDPGDDMDGDGFGENQDCDDGNPDINPGATDYSGDGIDQDCDGNDEQGLCNDDCSYSKDGECDDGGLDASYDVCDLGSDCSDCGPRRDNDGDQYYDSHDCDDADPNINPGAIDFSGDGVDQDCDGVDFTGLCSDDCQYANDGECDDGGSDASFDLCDLGMDCTDCGPRIDTDLDGFDDKQDCNDEAPTIHPEAADDQCDGIDNNCDTQIDEGWDGDKYEPNDLSPYDLIELEENSFLLLDGYISHENDVDSFSFYCHDGFGADFGIDVLVKNVPSTLDVSLELQFTDRQGNTTTVATSNQAGLGGDERLTWDGNFDDDTGVYTLFIRSESGSDCGAAYRLDIQETGMI